MKKTIFSKAVIRLSPVVAFAVGLVASAVAGPDQQNVSRVSAAKSVDTAMACAKCETKILREDGAPNGVNDQSRPRAVRRGLQHTCEICQGAVTRLQGAVKDQMVHSHDACATAACCKA